MSYETLLVDAKDGVASVTLNRPEVRNAFDEAMIAELTEFATGVPADGSVRATDGATMVRWAVTPGTT